LINSLQQTSMTAFLYSK